MCVVSLCVLFLCVCWHVIRILFFYFPLSLSLFLPLSLFSLSLALPSSLPPPPARPLALPPSLWTNSKAAAMAKCKIGMARGNAQYEDYIANVVAAMDVEDDDE